MLSEPFHSFTKVSFFFLKDLIRKEVSSTWDLKIGWKGCYPRGIHSFLNTISTSIPQATDQDFGKPLKHKSQGTE